MRERERCERREPQGEMEGRRAAAGLICSSKVVRKGLGCWRIEVKQRGPVVGGERSRGILDLGHSH